ncbi:MAG: leucine-rich repeat domain-containing protein [Muribaculaceae bacterium]|nr:leucine-rich repeat domain-containing protein [Muribaculaceae bacterium]
MMAAPCFAQFTHVPITGEEISKYEIFADGMSFRILDLESREVALTDRHFKFHFNDFGSYADLKEVPSSIEYENEIYKVVAIDIAPCVFSNELSLPESIVEISGCFENTEWTQFEFPKSLKNIGNGCFVECGEIKEISLPQALRKIGDNSFRRNEKLEKVEFGTNLMSIGGNSFSNNPNLKSAVLPNSLVSVGSGAFDNCEKLEYVKLPRWLPYEYGSRGETLKIFNGCRAIKVIEWESETPMGFPNCFDNVKKSECTVIVPDGFKDVYMENDYWKQFNIVEKSAYRAEVNEVPVSNNMTPSYYLLNGLHVTSEDNIESGRPYIKIEGDQHTKLIK